MPPPPVFLGWQKASPDRVNDLSFFCKVMKNFGGGAGGWNLHAE